MTTGDRDAVSRRPTPPWKQPIPPELKAQVEQEAKEAFDEGEALYLAGHYDDAYRVWQAVIEHFPGTQAEALAHRCTGQYWKNIKWQYGLAIQSYERAIALDPDGQIGRDARFGLGHTYYVMEDYRSAYRILYDLERLAIGGELGNNIGRWFVRARAKHDERMKWAARGIPLPERAEASCGPRALAAVCKQLGVQTDHQEIRRLSRMRPHGASMKDLKLAAQAKGLKATGLMANAAKLRSLRKPVVAWVADNHFVAVVRADQKGVDYLDGDRGRVHLDWDQWKLIWRGALLVVRPPAGKA